MGMDYIWSGSASYPRFNRELEEVAKALGARKVSDVEPFLSFLLLFLLL